MSRPLRATSGHARFRLTVAYTTVVLGLIAGPGLTIIVLTITLAVFGIAVLVVVGTIRQKAARWVSDALVRLAAGLAGPRRASDRGTWLADLAGVPEEGRPPLEGRRRIRYALLLVQAAIRMRLRDLLQWACRPLDWVLKTDGRIFAVAASVFFYSACELFNEGGVRKLCENGENLAAIGGLWFVGMGLRKIRGITPAPPRSRSPSADEPPEDRSVGL